MFPPKKHRLLPYLFLLLLIVLMGWRFLTPIDAQPFWLGQITFFLPQKTTQQIQIIRNFWQRVWQHYLLQVGENADLQELKQQLSAANAEIMLLRSQNQRLIAMAQDAKFAMSQNYRLLRALVVAREPFAGVASLWIDQGHDQGVRTSQPVVTSGGLIGKVWRTEARRAQVLLICDSHFEMMTLNTRHQGFVKLRGQSDGDACKLSVTADDFVRDVDLQIGDELVTTPLSVFFPPHLPVGKITQLERVNLAGVTQALAMPIADVRHAVYVMVVIEK